MIAIRNDLPLLQDHHGEVSALETTWLQDALERAARQAGFGEWWLADHVTSSVCSYLRDLRGVYSKNVVGLGRLQEAVKKALQDIGYEEIARYFQAEPPHARISLLNCAQINPPGDLDTFYKVLSTRVEELHQSKQTVFCFNDLGACILYLREANGEVKSPQPSDIVDFLRDKIGSLPWEQRVICSIS